MDHRKTQRHASRKARRRGRRPPAQAGDRTAQSSGARANQAKTPRQGGMGPASGNGNSSKPAERAAAAHNFQAPEFQNGGCILRRVYRIGRAPAEKSGEGLMQTAAPQAGKQATIVFMGLAIF